MKYILLIISVVSYVWLLHGCAKDSCEQETVAGRDKAMTFDVESIVSRGALTTTRNILEFSVFCAETKIEVWNNTTPMQKMFNQRVNWQDTIWAYDPPVYWNGGSGNRYSFFAYSPYARGMRESREDGNNLSMLTRSPGQGIPALRFRMMDEVVDQIDLLIAYPRYNLRPVDKVLLKFGHALAKIGFKAYSESQGTFLDRIEITGIQNESRLNLSFPNVGWSNESSKRDYVIEFNNGFPVRGDVSNPIDVSAPAHYLLAIPQNPTDVRFKFYYRQGDKEKTHLYEVKDAAWESGKGYIYVLNLGGDKTDELVVDRVVITDWIFDSSTDLAVDTEGKKFRILFDANGADGGYIPPSVELETGSKHKIPSEQPTLNGYLFAGWNTLKDGQGTMYQTGERVPVEHENITLYAQWRLK